MAQHESPAKLRLGWLKPSFTQLEFKDASLV